MKRVLFLAGCVWAAPVTLFGILQALLLGCKPHSIKGGAIVFRSGDWWNRKFFIARWVAAYTWGGCITCAQNYVDDEPILSHELVHFTQARIFGPFMPLVYGVCSLVAWGQGGNLYFDNALEKWARKVSGR